MSEYNKNFILGVLAIIAFFTIEQIDANYFRPLFKELSLKSSVECHDDINKCWMHNKSKN